MKFIKLQIYKIFRVRNNLGHIFVNNQFFVFSKLKFILKFYSILPQINLYFIYIL